MNLSVCLPLYNAASGVERLVSELLEVVPELTAGFEIVLIDDGSTDATAEIAHELSLRFPQVHMLCHTTRQGHEAALHTAGRHSTGDVLLLDESEYPLDTQGLCRLWNEISEHDVVIGVRAGGTRTLRRGSQRYQSWMRSRRRVIVPSEPGPILLRRPAMKDWIDAKTDRSSWIATLAGKDYHWIAVDLHDGPRSQGGRALERHSVRHGADVEQNERHTGAVSPAPLEPRRPNYLAQLRDFALGE